MPALQTNAAYNAETGTLAHEYRRAVEAALPVGISVTAAFWRELTSIVVAFSICQQNRASRPPATEIKRWERVKRLAIELDDLRAQDAAPLVALADAQIIGWRSMNEGFDRKRNLHHESLYGWTLDLWRATTGREFTVSRSASTGAVGGPLAVFFLAVTAPLLEKPITARAVAAIIDRKVRSTFLASENIS
jgi:hypothetical protein